MSFADLPPELVLHVAAALRDTRDIFALMRANRGLYRWLKKDLYQYNIDHENSSGLLRAVKKGNMSAICFFLGLAGVDLHARDGAGQTVLHLATQRHDAFSIIMLLLRDGRVDINALDSDRWSALSYAVRRRNHAAVRRLLESGADAGIQHVDGVTPLNMAVAQGDEVIVRMFLKVTPRHRELCLAASTGRANIVQLLLDHGADINEEDYYGQTPLDRARKRGHVDIEEILLKHRSL
jgi:ankyrin repeat protein